jgi:hypothetical protein
VKLNLMLSGRDKKSKSPPILYRGTNIENVQKEDLIKLFVNFDNFPAVKSYQVKIVGTLAVDGNFPS